MRLRNVAAWLWLGIILAGWIGILTWNSYLLWGPWGLLVAALLFGLAGASGYAVAVWLD